MMRHPIPATLFCLALILTNGCELENGAKSAATDAEQQPAEQQPAEQQPAEQQPAEQADEKQQKAEKKPGTPGKAAAKDAHVGIVTENHLVGETSLYLLMHAKNPVDWYPWSPAALEKAKKENKLIFLSIGYSSCHWCHVMEHESFMDKEIAAFMNQHFVCIKVDREERPDVDAIYMQSLQIFNQISGNGRGGGWPLSMFLTPDGRPFFGGTYFPARDGDRGAGLGFLSILDRVRDVWEKDAVAIGRDADVITRIVKQSMEGAQSIPKPIDAAFPVKIHTVLQQQFDPEHGGFGFSAETPNRPKFPEPSNLQFLIDRIQRGGDDAESSQNMLTTSLDRMASGGIRDHLGGGFHRYSVDRFWHIPHFEKMLYDNGQLATIYAEAFAITGKPAYRQVVDEMLTFIAREMTAPEGGFLTALDADSDGEEGKFYRWSKKELDTLLDAEQKELFFSIYQIDQPPNFEEHFYAPQLAKPLSELAAERKTTEEALEEQLVPIRKKLFDVRAKRIRPLTDEKILTSWNGLMIRGMADAGRILDNPEYVAQATSAAEFVLKSLRTEDGRLQRTYGKGQAKLNAYLNDYAFMAHGLIGLHRATGEERWLDEARQLTDQQINLFWDKKGKGFYFISNDHETLLARAKSPTDGAQPSGNSIAALNLLYLADKTGDGSYREFAKETVEAMIGLNEQFPHGAPLLGIAAAELLKE